MKKIFFLIIITLFGIELNSQSINKSSGLSTEVSIGVGKVGLTSKNDLRVDQINCIDCVYRIIGDEGYEYNLRLTVNKAVNSHSEIYAGIGLTLWTYEIDNISGLTYKPLSTSSDLLGLMDLIVGYRFVVNDLIFIESTFHSEFNTEDIFRKFRFSIEPGIGFKIKLDDTTQFLPVLSYKQSLTNFSASDYNKQRPYIVGIRLAINKAF